MSLHAHPGIGADRNVPTCVCQSRPGHTKVFSAALHKHSRRKHGISQGVVCFGGKILSTIFRRSSEVHLLAPIPPLQRIIHVC